MKSKKPERRRELNYGTITLRPATMDDAETLLAWRNDSITRQMSLSADEVPLEGHLEWLKNMLSRPDRFLFVAECAGKPVGQARLDFEGNEAEISVTIAPEHRGRRLAKPLIEAALDWLRAEGGPTRVLAVIKAENEASKRTFAKCGFVRKDVACVRGVEADRWFLELSATKSSRTKRSLTFERNDRDCRPFHRP